MKVLLNFNDDGTVTCENWLNAIKEVEDVAHISGYEEGFTAGQDSMKNEEFRYTLLDLLEKKEEGYKEGLEEGFRRGKEAGKESAKDAIEDLVEENGKAYQNGYIDGKRDGEKSRFFDIPDEVKKHIDEVVKWLET